MQKSQYSFLFRTILSVFFHILYRFYEIYAHLIKGILSEKNLQSPDIRLTRTYFDFLLSQTGQFQLQCSRQSIDNFQPYLSRLTVFHDTDAHIAFQDLRQLQIRSDINVTTMYGEHLLHLIAFCRAYLIIIKVHHIRIPVGITILAKQRCIRGHFHHIAITFHTTEMNTFCQGTVHLIISIGCIFTEIYLRHTTVIMVVIVLMIDKPTWFS